MSNSTNNLEKYVFFCPQCGAYKPTFSATKAESCSCIYCKKDTVSTDLTQDEYDKMTGPEKDAAFLKYRYGIVKNISSNDEGDADSFSVQTVTKHRPIVIVIGLFVLAIITTFLKGLGAIPMTIIYGFGIWAVRKISEYTVEIPAGVTDTKPVEEVVPDMKFRCFKCGGLSSGWYQTCPKCGAVGTMQKLEKAETVTDEPSNDVAAFCPECGTKLEEDSIFCPECGFKIEKVKEQPIERTIPTEEKKESVNNQTSIIDDVPRFCLECGTKLSEDSVFCPECGTKVVTVKQRSIKTESEVKAPVKVSVKEPVKIQPVIQLEEVLFCHKCGYKLKPGSDFCSHCGAKIADD